MNRTFKQLRRKFDGNEPFLDGGHQITKIYQEDRDIPEWAQNHEGMKKILLQSFPRLHVDLNQRARAARWARVMYLYFVCRYTYSFVAEEMNENPRTIEMVIRAITRVSQGLRANGSGIKTRKLKSAVIETYLGGTSERPKENPTVDPRSEGVETSIPPIS